MNPVTHTPTEQIVKLARLLQRFAILLMIVVVPASVGRWLVTDTRGWLPPTLAAQVSIGGLSSGQRLLGLAVELIPLSAAIYALFALYRICGNYSQERVFDPDTSALFRRFGTGLFLLGVGNGFYTMLLSVVLSYSTAKRLTIAIGLSTADLYLLLVGSSVMMLAHVMDEAHRIRNENDQII